MNSWRTKMVFLRVFCVVLYLHTGVSVSMPNQLSVPKDPPELSSKSFGVEHKTQSVQNAGETILSSTLLPNLRGKDNINLKKEGLTENCKSHKIQPQPQNDQQALPLNSLPEFIAVPVPNSGQNLNNMNFPRDEMRKTSIIQPGLAIPLPTAYQNAENINRQRDLIRDDQPMIEIANNQPSKIPLELPLKPEENPKLKLQGKPLEYLKLLLLRSFGCQNPPKHQLPVPSPVPLVPNSYSTDHRPENLKYLGPTDKPNKAISENPTAEILYKMKKALPYRINDQVFTDVYEDTLHRILNNAKRLQDIHTSVKQGKHGMIIHPDGTIEHIDNLDTATGKYPNYITISSTDLTKLGDGNNANFIPTSLTQSLRKEDSLDISSPIVTELEIPFVKQEESEGVVSQTTNISLDSKPNTLEVTTNSFITPTTSNVLKEKSTITETEQGNQDDHQSNLNLSTDEIKQAPSEITTDSGNSYETEDSTNKLHAQIDSASTPLPNVEKTEHSKFWFEADEKFWEKIIKETQNSISFIFVPPAPKVKETIRTIYPNGTIVEEVVETVDKEPCNSCNIEDDIDS